SRLLPHPLASLAEIDAIEVHVAKAARVTMEISGAAFCVRWIYLLAISPTFFALSIAIKTFRRNIL
ncbi:unnamed protein product, partial [marine sediment metagenome]